MNAECVLVISLSLFSFIFFLNFFQSLLLQSRFWSFIQVTYHFLMVSLCWMLNQNNCDWKKNDDSEFLVSNWIHTPQLGLEADLVHQFFIFHTYDLKIFILFHIFSNCFPILITSTKIWKLLSIRSKIIYIGKKLWEWISSSNLFWA